MNIILSRDLIENAVDTINNKTEYGLNFCDFVNINETWDQEEFKLLESLIGNMCIIIDKNNKDMVVSSDSRIALEWRNKMEKSKNQIQEYEFEIYLNENEDLFWENIWYCKFDINVKIEKQHLVYCKIEKIEFNEFGQGLF